MAKRITIKDIARQAGVSLGTVHCALSGKAGVGEATRKRIQDIARDKGYRPNAVAASLKRKTVHIGAAFPEPSGENRYYFPHIWKGVRDYLGTIRDLNVDLIELPYRKGEGRRDGEIESLFQSGKLDGLLTVGFMDDFGPALSPDLKRFKIPVVVVGDDIPQSERLCCVQPDYEIVGRVMAELISRQIPADGSILLCAGNAAMSSHYLVVTGFDAYLHENGLKHAVYKIHTEAYGEEGTERVARDLERHNDIAACASVNARGSVLLAQALLRTNRAGTLPAVGSDLFGESAAYLRDNVLTNIVHKNPYRQAFMAASILVERLLRDVQPLADVVFVNSEVIFRSALPMFDGEGMLTGRNR